MINKEFTMIERALCIAVDAHKGQIREYSGEPYIVHPIAVFQGVDGEDAKVVALLHDGIEDSDIELESLYQVFPKRIVDAVDGVTRRDDESYGDFILRVKENELARIVKIADIEHNMSTLPGNHNLRDRYEKALRELKGEQNMLDWAIRIVPVVMFIVVIAWVSSKEEDKENG